ncbi:MAG: aminotransferase class I/II-fold pyridoxal phosphate-dependent enzyme [Thermodesulfobacteriota bacterium]
MGIIVKESGDRRKHERIPVTFQVYSKNSGKLIGPATNLSAGGLFLESTCNFTSGTKILINCNLPNFLMPVKAYCDVKWKRAGETTPIGIGLQFLSIFESDRIKLKSYIESSKKKLDSNNLSLADFVNISDKNIFKKAEVFWEFIEDTNNKDLNKYGTPIKSANKNRVLIRDKKSGVEREVIMMGSSNYLGLTTHPRVINAAKLALENFGTGTGSVRLLSGTHDMHQKLESKLAELKGCEAAVIFPSGHMANMGCIASLLGKKDIAIVDKNVHASILDGCGLSMGSFKTFRHSDTEHLNILLKNIKDRYQGKLVILEGVDGIDGDIAPLPEICRIAEEHGAKVIIDDAHATGVIGDMGRGTTSHFKLESGVDIVMDSLSKAIGSLGGYVASTREIVRYLNYYARTSFFSASAPVSTVAAALTAVEIMQNEPALIAGLWNNIRYMKENLIRIGFNNIEKSESAIISTIIGDELIMRKMNKMIFDEGVYLEPIPYPGVPRGQERLRLRVMATHTRDDLDKTLESLEKSGLEHGVIRRTYSLNSTHHAESSERLHLVTTDNIAITEITTNDAITESIKLSWKIYQDNPYWVPNFLIKDRIKLLAGDHYLYFKKNIISKRFAAEVNGELVGTLSVFLDNRDITYWGQNVGSIGYFEAHPDNERAINLLFDAALEFLKNNGAESVLAPLNVPFVFYGCGLLSGGHDITPSFLQPYAPAYYHPYFEAAGFRPVKHLPHFSIDLSYQENIARIHELAGRTRGKIRELSKSKYDLETSKVLKIYNESFPKLWRYCPFTNDEFSEFTNDFRDMIVQGLWLIAEVNNQEAGFVGAFPEYAQLFQKLNGELGPNELLSWPQEVSKIKEGAIDLLGVLEKFENMDIGLQLLANLCMNMIDKGYRKASCTWGIIDNKINAEELIGRLGGVKDTFEWIIYGKDLKQR